VNPACQDDELTLADLSSAMLIWTGHKTFVVQKLKLRRLR